MRKRTEEKEEWLFISTVLVNNFIRGHPCSNIFQKAKRQAYYSMFSCSLVLYPLFNKIDLMQVHLNYQSSHLMQFGNDQVKNILIFLAKKKDFVSNE